MRFGQRRKTKKTCELATAKRAPEPKDAALKINSEAQLDAPQVNENNQKYARMTHRAPEKHHISNAKAATKRDATQRKQPSHAPSAEETQKAQAAPPTQRRRAEPKKNSNARLDAPYL